MLQQAAAAGVDFLPSTDILYALLLGSSVVCAVRLGCEPILEKVGKGILSERNVVSIVCYMLIDALVYAPLPPPPPPAPQSTIINYHAPTRL